MLAHSAGGQERGERLFLLARLELELAILHEARARGAGDWEAPALSCRRLLLEEPGFRDAGEVRLFLARLELRRGRATAALAVTGELERGAASAELRCRARLVAGEAWTAAGRPERAAASYRASACAGEAGKLARYRLAWALLAAKQPTAAAQELVALAEAGPAAGLRERVLRDLALAWSLGEPARDAVPVLLRLGGPRLGPQLVIELAGRLRDERRLTPLLALTLAPAVARPLTAIRVVALGRLGSAAELERELARLRGSELGRAPEVRGAMLRGLLEAARRQERGSAEERRQARSTYARLLAEHSQAPEAQEARLHLAELLLAGGELEAAASHLAQLTAASPALRARAGYQRVYCLERLLAAAPAARQPALRGQLIAAARGYLASNSGEATPRTPSDNCRGAAQVGRSCEAAATNNWPSSIAEPPKEASRADTAGAAEVQLLLAGQLAAAGDRLASATAAERFLQRAPTHPRRSEALALALRAYEAERAWEPAHRLASAELAACQLRGGHLQGDAPRLQVRVPAASGRLQVRVPAASGRSGMRPPQSALLASRGGSAMNGEFAAAGEGETCTDWRTTTARLALRRCRELASRGQLEEAATWAGRALAARPAGALRGETLTAAALVALRRGRPDEGERLYRELAAGGDDDRRRGQLGLAELLEARGLFAGAAAAYALAAAPASGEERLRLLVRVARARLAAQDPAAALRAARELGRALDSEQLPPRLWLRWQLRLGELLERSGGPALRHYLRLGAQLEREDPRAAARALLRGSAVAAAGRGASLATRALQLAGPLRRGGVVSPEAAEARVLIARFERARLARGRGGATTRLLALQALLPPLQELLTTGDPRWAPAAGLELASLHGELSAALRRAPLPSALRAEERATYRRELERRAGELDQVRAALLGKLASLGRGAAGPTAVTLAAARQLAAPAIAGLRAEHQPDPTPATRAALELLRAGRASAAAVAATRALALLGERADLLCVRGLAWLEERPEAAARDLRAALEADPRSRCARLNLATLALWQGDSARARELLEAAPAGASVAALLRAAGPATASARGASDATASARSGATPAPDSTAAAPALEEPGQPVP